MRRLPALVLFFSFLSASVTLAGDAEYRRIRDARPTGTAVAVDNVTLQRDAFRFNFAHGTLHLIDNGAGTPSIGAVFIGQGSYELTPGTASERRHLGLVTRSRDLESLRDTFEHLVLLYSDASAEELERAGTPLQGGADPQALRHYDDYLKLQKTKLQLNLHLRLLRDQLNEVSPEDGVFLAAFSGRQHGQMLAVVDPTGIGNLAAGLSLFGGEEVALLSLDDFNGGFWYLAGMGESGEVSRGKALQLSADAEHYTIDTTIASNLAIDATTTIRFSVTRAGIRVLPLHILPKLRLAEATFSVAGGAEFPAVPVQEEIELGRFKRLFRDEVADADAAVIFPAPLPAGLPIELRIRYSGRDVLHRVGADSYSVRARESWYPNFGAFTDPATYELTFRYPRRQQLVATGLAGEEVTAGDQKVAVWKSDGEIRVAGFNYGRFEKMSRHDEPSGANVDLYTHRDFRKTASDSMADALNTARVGTLYFGRTPYSTISVTQQAEWNFGQSWPGLIYLPPLALTTSTDIAFMAEQLGPRVSELQEFAKMVGWHEYAHQWWGHQVGWQSYRDQWLSEGFAEFTAALVLQFTENTTAYERYFGRRRREILGRTPGGLVLADAGPISNGMRMETRHSPGAYQTLVYSKGAWVLHMLRMMMVDSNSRTPDEKFMTMMRDFVATHSGGSPSTADFQKIVEKHMTPPMNASGNGSMSWFFDQWIHGTEIPKLSSDLSIAKTADGKYRIHGSVTQSGVSELYKTVVPLYLDFGRDSIVRLAQAVITGNRSMPVDVEVELPRAPRRAVLNAMSDVLTRD
jgi:hypothetical protein